ncbi:MAG: carbon-nitrogen hydrolase family protein [Candidatus Helarchaeota archaeon]
MEVNIACLQMASVPYNWDYNIEKATNMVRTAAEKGAQFLILPEVFIPGYSHSDENFRQAEYFDGPTVATFLALAKELKIHVLGSFIEKTERDFYNTMFVIGPEGLLGTYRKMHVYSMEQKYWKCGKKVSIVDTEFGAIGLGICADMHYPKLWQQYAGKVDLIAISSAWPEKPSATNMKFAVHEMQLCRDLPIQISEALQVPTAYCNACHPCVGELPLGLGRMVCQGYSKIVDKGKVLAAVNSGEEQIIQAKVHIAETRPEIDPKVFKKWIQYSFKEQVQRFFVEKLALLYAKPYYWRHKRKYLRKIDK